MATQVQNRRGTTAEHSTFTGANGEVTVDTTKKTVVVHDGTTVGGAPLLRENGSQNAVTTGTSTAASFIPSSSTVPTNGVYLPAANSVGISTNGTGRLSIDANGNVAVDTNTLYVDAVNNRVAVGTTSPSALLDVNGTIRAGVADGVALSCSSNSAIRDTTNGNSAFYFDVSTGGSTNGAFIWRSSNAFAERARIDSSGRLLVGTSSARGFFNGTFSTGLQVEGTGSLRSLSVTSDETDGGGGAVVVLAHQKSGSVGGNTTLANNDALGALVFQGSNGSQMLEGASVSAFADGTISGGGAADLPTRLVFSVTADGASSPTERMRISSSGTVTIGPSTTNFNSPGVALNPEAAGQAWFVRDNNYVMYVNRLTSDGDLIQFAQASTLEGTISVSGTTVSYNGAHLSRWSQLPSGAERTEILRGSVLSNINEMCEWTDEENEQLNRMKVSDVEGDKNVAGVFQGWDDDDDTYTNDFYCAMTGDFIIRIGAGVTVERGDLLMSAGDGTAKPQDDDIIRSKTIAKVTSTNVSCTYEDGSYCVPCVLMAC